MTPFSYSLNFHLKSVQEPWAVGSFATFVLNMQVLSCLLGSGSALVVSYKNYLLFSVLYIQESLPYGED